MINITKINDDQDTTTKTMFHEITVNWLKLLLGLQKKGLAREIAEEKVC